ncbi:hypothetical protein ACLB2K_069653 [Fragaria x ananassa]
MNLHFLVNIYTYSMVLILIGKTMNSTKRLFRMFFIFLALPLCISLDTITPNQPIRDDKVVLVSSRNVFALGFFSPGNSSKRYIGVWYNNVPNRRVVWVANRDNPINDTSSGLLAIHEDGGLNIYGKDSNIPIWSANITLSWPNNTMAKLFDTGNLVLLDNNNGSQRVLWQSSDHPSDTMLRHMKLGLDRRSGLNRYLTSWKSQDDPGTGNCTYGVNPNGFPQLILYKGTTLLWRFAIGCLGGLNHKSVLSYVNNENEVSIMYNEADEVTGAVVEESGVVRRSTWTDDQWTTLRFTPWERCDNYGSCGPNSNCMSYNVNNDLDCMCLPGFEPKSPTDWNKRVWSGGCVRNKNGTSLCRNGEGFVKVELIKIPESSTIGDGKVTTCVTWHGDELMDTRTLPNTGHDLYVRVDAIVFAQYGNKSMNSISKKRKLAILLASIVPVIVLLASLVYCQFVWKKKEGKQRENRCSLDLDELNRRNSDLPFFDLTIIAAATNNFSDENKLGTGGFGSVYKGVLCNGKEIAVKRLSNNSGQGTEEFKSEVMLTAKLQHRNLVRILGSCVQEGEKMIIYEYLPNKSLDRFIFNESSRAHLDWTKRFEIICGVAKGMLYLHEDSRLRIIHRDLKASNILLDASMNPKIADFGLARILGGDEKEANTKRVIGTYGYMSPEYAMRGLFSVKSDIYSYGVLVLEIITGIKNTSYYPRSSLVEQVWNLWEEGNELEVVDSSLGESYHVDEVLRCIKIAFLCVKEYAADRPNMSAVLLMLGSNADLPDPIRPAFSLERSNNTEDSSANVNEYTTLEAR